MAIADGTFLLDAVQLSHDEYYAREVLLERAPRLGEEKQTQRDQFFIGSAIIGPLVTNIPNLVIIIIQLVTCQFFPPLTSTFEFNSVTNWCRKRQE